MRAIDWTYQSNTYVDFTLKHGTGSASVSFDLQGVLLHAVRPHLSSTVNLAFQYAEIKVDLASEDGCSRNLIFSYYHYVSTIVVVLILSLRPKRPSHRFSNCYMMHT